MVLLGIMMEDICTNTVLLCQESVLPEHREKRSHEMPDSILIADDDAAIRDPVSTFLHRLSYQVYTAEDPEKALKIIDAHHVDVVISDIHMGDMSGLELTQKIREKSDIDVMVMTGYHEEYSYEEAVNAGAADFLFKPKRKGSYGTTIGRTGLHRRADRTV